MFKQKLSKYYTVVLSEAWAKFRDWASVAGRGRLLLSGSVAHAFLKTAAVPKLHITLSKGNVLDEIDPFATRSTGRPIRMVKLSCLT